MSTTKTPVERVQLGVRMERSMVKVLKGLAEFEGVTLGQLLEKIVLHSFEPAPGQEGEMSASPHGKKALAAIEDLKRIYGMPWDSHSPRAFLDDLEATPDEASSDEPAKTAGHPRRARDAAPSISDGPFSVQAGAGRLE